MQKRDAHGDYWLCDSYNEKGKKARKRVTGLVPHVALLRRATRDEVVSCVEFALFRLGLHLKKIGKTDKKTADEWAAKVVLPWLKANKNQDWLKALVPDGKFGAPTAVGQVLRGLSKPS